MDIKKIHFDKYKCFEKITLENLKPINIIIGKNNIGKSSILDIVEMIYDINKFSYNSVKIQIEKPLIYEEISRVFSTTTSGGGIPGNTHYEFGEKFIGEQFIFEIYNYGNKEIKKRSFGDISTYNKIYNIQHKRYWDVLAQNMTYENKITKRVLAERNIFPEEESELMKLDGNGNGITTVISNFINKTQYDESLVRVNLLNKLNEIMGEDATFTEIVTQQIKIQDTTKWEIFLREDNKGRIPLSASGSGLKTILMVLVYTILVPIIEKSKLENYIFMFEELENNLHPSLQRRLLKYIEDLSNKGATFFLTTHSNILLDTFQNNSNINILHVIKDDENNVNLYNASDNIQKNQILNDLGIKASDLLQANGVIWVEGPSDRIYINKWLQLWSNDTLKEGKDYQCVFYGGRLLSNLSYDEQTELINLMKVNRNSIILIDSDKKSSHSPINKSKQRIQKEALSNEIMCWLTKGREIENYLPETLIKQHYNLEKKKSKFNQFDNLEDFLNKLKTNEGKIFLRSKIEFAKTITENTTILDFKNIYDLNVKMNKLIKIINAWNKN